jgi:hypothetical protein
MTRRQDEEVMCRFTRQTTHSRKTSNDAAAVALHFMNYNFRREHEAPRVTPAMEAGIPDHVWEIEELAALIP